jgi:hypothetical protein
VEQNTATTPIELNDAVMCSQHFKEQCSDCGVDFRQEDEFFGVRDSRSLAYCGVLELKSLRLLV